MSLSNVQKMKLQLYHRLQRRHRNVWKQYWSSFQLFLMAKISLEEFHALAEDFLGPDKHMHNKFVISLLSTTGDQENTDLYTNQQPPPALEMPDYKGKEEINDIVINRRTKTVSRKDMLLQNSKKNCMRYDDDDDQRQKEPLGGKRSHSSIVSINTNVEETVVKKLMHLHQDQSHNRVHPDHQSAQLLMELGKFGRTSSPSSIVIAPVSTPSNNSKGLE
ncbi:unnamed protein product [Peronospora belbahrii]|uniref:Uncharacterized protein n=1 Tax=Peronospora belbahrii TaxID=622444 RepID=A0ABN8CXD4_9STRA|nr:unnamed protein product [Peronospora belbahrii]